MKKGLMLLLSIMLVVTMTPAIAFAEGEVSGAAEPAVEVQETEAEEAVCSIGTQGYATLQVAVEEVKDGETIKLLKEAEGITVANGMSFTIDLNGNDIKTPEDEQKVTIEVSKGDLTITGDGIINAKKSSLHVHGANSEATLKGGTYFGAINNQTAVYAYDGAHIDIYGGKFIGEKAKTAGEKEGKVFYSGTTAAEYYYETPGSISIYGGTFQGRMSDSNWGNYYICGGTFDRNEVQKYDNPRDAQGNPRGVSENLYKTQTMEDAGWLADGYVAASQADGTYVIKVPVADVISSTLPLKKNKTVDVLKNIKVTEGDAVVSATSSNTKIATVTGTTIKGIKKGLAIINVKTKYGKDVSYIVKVQKGKVKANKITLNVPAKVTMQVGTTLTITADVAPVTCKTKATFKSTKKKVAKVSKSGVVKAKKAGTAKIKVKCDNKTKIIKVKVVN